MSPDDVKNARKAAGLTVRELAEALSLEVSVVRDWESGEQFPTKAHCAQLEALAKNPPPKKSKRAKTPMESLADPAFFLLVRKLLSHPTLRAETEKLAEKYPDPLDESHGSS